MKKFIKILESAGQPKLCNTPLLPHKNDIAYIFSVAQSNIFISADNINDTANIFDGEYLSTSTASAIFDIPEDISKDDPAQDTSVFFNCKFVIKASNQKP